MLISANYFIMKVPNICELQQIALNYSSGIDYYDFMRICRRCTNELYSLLFNDTILLSDHSLNFKKDHIDEISQNKQVLSQILIVIMTIDETIRDEKL